MNKKNIAILPFVILAVLVTGCKYDEKPPRTEVSASDYVLPQGELPTDAERQAVEAARAEYNEAVGIE